MPSFNTPHWQPEAPRFGQPEMPWQQPQERLTPQQQFAMQFPAESAVGIINTGQMQNRIHAYGAVEALQRIQQVTQFMERTIESPGGVRQQMENLRLPPQVEQTIGEILDRLVQHGPEEVGGTPNPLMVYMHQEGRGTSTTYYVNARRIAQDKRYLEMLMSSMPPQQQAVLQSIVQLLDTYGWQSDPHRMAYHQYNEERANTPVNRGLRNGMRFMGLVGGGALALLNGVISYRTGNISMAPFLYGALALYSANPNILEGRAMHVAREANEAVGALQRNNLAGRFGMQGTEWSNFAEDAMNGSMLTPETRQLLQRLQRGETLTQDEIDTLDTALIPPTASTGMRSNLYRMINNSQMLPLLTAFGRVRDMDARELVQNYLLHGAWRYGQQQTA